MSKSRNFLASLVLVVAGASANTEFAVAHGLVDMQGNGIMPADAFVCRVNGNAILYRSTTSWDTTNAYLKSDTGSAQFYVLFFV